ncbi:MAG: BMC domain-containing protein [bacterium]|nr:BMC domain-containing protein [bacterium]
MARQAIGFIETIGANPSIQAADAMCKAAGVTIADTVEIGGGYVTTIIAGDVGSVKAAVDAGAEIAHEAGELISAHVIAQPHEDLMAAMLGA